MTQAVFFKRMIYYWLSEGQLILMLLGDESAYKLHQVIKKSLQQRIEINVVPIIKYKNVSDEGESIFYLFFMSNAISGVLQDWVKRGYKRS